MSLHANATRTLADWSAPSPGQDELRLGYLAHLAEHVDGVWKDGPREHLTASLMVFDVEVRAVLLTLHRKGGFWVQFGGHCEPADGSLAETALREGREESGIPDLRLLRADPVDLDRHALTARFGRCAEHLDVAFVALAGSGVVPVVSAESDDVAWWPLDALPPDVVPDLPARLARAAAGVRGRYGGGRSGAADSPSR